MDILTPPKNAFIRNTEDGQVIAWNPSPDVAIHKISGNYSAALATYVREYFDQVFVTTDRPIHIFGAFAGITSYESEMREAMTRYTHAHRDSISDLNYLIGTKKLAMGITVFGLEVTGTPVHSYLSAEAFKEAIARALRGGEEKRSAA